MELLSIIKFSNGLMTSRQSIDNPIGAEYKKKAIAEAIISVICELTMEYGHHTAVSEDNTGASFIFDVLICEDLTCDVTFMGATHYTVEVTMHLDNADRPAHDEHIGHYVYLPIHFEMTKDDESTPYIVKTYWANIRSCYAIQQPLIALGKAYTFNSNITPPPRQPFRPHRFASSSCEAMGMDD